MLARRRLRGATTPHGQRLPLDRRTGAEKSRRPRWAPTLDGFGFLFGFHLKEGIADSGMGFDGLASIGCQPGNHQAVVARSVRVD